MARSVFLYTDSHTLGGAEVALLMLAETLDRAAWRPTLLVEATAPPMLAERARALEIPVRPVPPLPLGLGGARRVPSVVRLLRAERPDVFHAHLSWPLAAKYGLLAAIGARVPAIVASVQLVPHFQLDRLSFLQLRALAAGVGRYIAVSHDIASELVGRFGWSASKIQVIHNAVVPDRFRTIDSAELRAELTDGRPRALVLTCARLVPQKGLPVLLAAATQLPDALFVIAGDGPQRAALEAQAAALGIADRVLFLGYRQDVPELLGACDVFALPSLFEGTSLAVLEAMAAGRAVVSSAIGGTDELIEDGKSGLLVPAGDAGALASALRRLLADADLRTALGARAQGVAIRDFSSAVMAGRVSRVYEELLAGAPIG